MKKHLHRAIIAVTLGFVIFGCQHRAPSKMVSSKQGMSGQNHAAINVDTCAYTDSATVRVGLAGRNSNHTAGFKNEAQTVIDTIAADNVMLLIGRGAVSPDVDISIETTTEENTGEMPDQMENLSVGGAVYRMLPDGQRFDRDITIAMGYDSAALPYGYTPDDIYTFFYNEQTRMWQQVERDSVDTLNHIVYSRTDHFTDYINGVLKVPENSDAMAYTPTSIKDIKAADPLEGVTMMAPPEANNVGTANLTYPLNLPAGRRGMQPQLAITYNSAAGSGILGLGWDLPVSEICVDTRRGVPLYSDTLETETYTLDGDILVTSFLDANDKLHLNKPAYRTQWRNRDTAMDTVRFYPRVEGRFRRIQRINTSPKTYYWVVTEKNGTKFYYGDNPSSRLCDGKGNIFRWCLSRVEDTYGNTITYVWEERTLTLTNLNPGRQMLLRKINYTGKDGFLGRYNIDFYYSSTKKPDATVSARGGFLESDGFLLDHLDVCFDTTIIRSYYLGYKQGAFGKTLLCNIVEADLVTMTDEGVGFDNHIFTTQNSLPNWIDTSGILDNIYCHNMRCTLLGDSYQYADNFRIVDSVGKPIFSRDVFERCAPASIKCNYYTFYEHRFDYSGIPASLFGDTDTITNEGLVQDNIEGPLFLTKGTSGPIDATGTKSWNVGGGLEVGFGYNTTLKSVTTGGNYTYSESENEGLVTLVDLNGDGLVDKLFKRNDRVFYRLRRNDDISKFGTAKNIEGLSDFMYSSGHNNTWGIEACLGVGNSVAFGANITYGSNTVSTYLSDVDGDGLPDLIRDTTTYYNRIYSNPDKVFVEAPSGVMYDTLSVCGEEYIDTIFGGEYVDRTMFEDSEGDTMTITVCRNSVVKDGLDNLVDTVICYDSTIVTSHHVTKPYEPNLENVRMWVAPYGGIVTVDGVAQLAGSPLYGDGVGIIVQHDTTVKFSGYLLPDGYALDVYLPSCAVEKGDRLFFRVLSGESRIADRIVWNPVIRYTSLNEAGMTLGDSIGTDGLNKYVYSYRNDFVLGGTQKVKMPYNSRVRFVSNVSTRDGYVPDSSIRYQIMVNGAERFSLTIGNGVSADSSMVTDTLEKNDSVQIRMISPGHPAKWGSIDAICRMSIVENLSQDPEDSLFECIDTLSRLGDTVYFFDIYPQIEKVLDAEYGKKYALFGTMYRNWGQFAYKSPDGAVRLDTSLLHLDSFYGLSQDDSSIYSSLDTGTTVVINGIGVEATATVSGLQAYNPMSSPFFPMQPDFAHGCWSAYSDYAYVGRDTLSNVPHPAAGMSVAQYDSLTVAGQTVMMSDSAKLVLKVTKNFSWGAHASAHLEIIGESFPFNIGGSYTRSSSQQHSDMMDLNGDGLPDVLSMWKVQYSKPQGGLSKRECFHNIDSTHLDSTVDHTYGGSFSGSAIFTTSPKGGRSSRTLSFTPGASLDGTATNGSSIVSWVDLNGDGLPDKVVKANGGLAYYQNMGYGFMGKRVRSDGDDVRKSFNSGSSGGVSLAAVLGHSWRNNAFLGLLDSIHAIAPHLLPDSIAQFPDSILRVFLDSILTTLPDSLLNQIVDSATRTVLDSLLNKLRSINFNNRLNVSLTAGMNTSVSSNNNILSYFDINGDGLPDQVEKYRNGYLIRFNTGNSFGGGMAMLLVDADTDNVASTTDLSAAITAGITVGAIPLKIEINPKGGLSRSLSSTRAQWMDVNGDGVPDYVWESGENAISAIYSNLGTANRITRVTLPTKGTYDIGYTLNDDGPLCNIRHYVMSDLSITDNMPGTPQQHRSFIYRNRVYDRKEREDFGYSDVETVEDETFSGTADYRRTYMHFLNSDYMFHGLCDTIRVLHADTVYSEEYRAYSLMDISTGESVGIEPGCHGDGWPALEMLVKTTYDINNTYISTVQFFYYGQYGNLVEAYDIGDPEDPDDDYIATTTYDSIGDYVVSAVTGEHVSGNAQRHREASYNSKGDVSVLTFGNDHGGNAVYNFTYDEYGNVDTVVYPQNVDGQSFWVSYKYDAATHSMPTETSNAYGLVSTITYDPLLQKPTLTVSVNGGMTEYDYDSRGRLVSLYAPFEYGTSVPTIRYEYFYGCRHDQRFWDTCRYWARTLNLNSININPQYIGTVTVSDGLGRPRVVKRDADVDGHLNRIVSGWTELDGLGRTIKEFHPTVEDMNSDYLTVSPPPTNTLYTHYSYDYLDRATTIRYPDNTVVKRSYSIGEDADGYLRMLTVTTDQNGHLSRCYANARGQTTTTVDPLGGTTLFHYDNLGQLVETIDPEGYSTTHQYDGLGRRIQRVHPAAGTTTWTYDAAGNMLLQTQNNGEWIGYHYFYNRPIGIDYSTHSQNNAWYEYGTSGTGAGRIVKQQDATGVQEFGYDQMGNVVYNRHTYVQPYDLHTLTLTTHWGYDSWGRVASIVYPDGEKVTYHYDHGGLLHDIQGHKNGTVGDVTYIKAIEYNQFGLRTFMLDGDNVKTTYEYDPASLRLVHLKNLLGNTHEVLQDNFYFYDAVGNIDSIRDNGRNRRVQHYWYDEADRIIQSDGIMPDISQNFRYTSSYSYSPGGRLTHKAVDSWRINNSQGLHRVAYRHEYRYENPGNPYAASKIFDLDGTVYYPQWDANGNLDKTNGSAAQSGRKLCWTEDNRLQAFMESSREGCVAAYYNYSADGKRNLKLTSPRFDIQQNGLMAPFAPLVYPTLYASPLLTLTKQGYTKHYFEEGRRICSKIGGGFMWSVQEDSITDRVHELGYSYDELCQSQMNGMFRTFSGCIGVEPQIIGVDLQQVLVERELRRDMEEPSIYYHGDHLGSAAYLTSRGQIIQTLTYLPYGEDWYERNTFSPDDTTRFGVYRFNGKEKDYESGFHYYGARYYWSELLTGWLSVDPMMDKYPGISPYNYCMWNPVRLVDPDGRKIWIVGDDRNTYQYKGGKLYTIDGTIYEGNDVFAMKVLGDLNTLIKNGMSEQINALEGSTKTHTIRRTSQSNETKPNNNNDIANGKGCNTTISYNPNLEKEEGWKRPPVVGLAHEMQHAFEMDAGEYNNTTVLCKKEAFMFTSVVVNNIPVCGNTICMDYGVVFYDVFREIEKGEYSAIQVANLVYRNLGGTKMRTRINGYTIDQLR